MRLMRIVVCSLLGALLAACGPDVDLDGNALHRGLLTDPESLDPQQARSVQAAQVLRDIREGLLGLSPGGELVPAAAESWTVSDDGLVYTFTIRDDARWSNGEAVTAEHFVLGLQRLVDPAVAGFYAQTIEDIVGARDIIAGRKAPTALGARALDANTLEITLERPVPYLLSLLTHPSTFPAWPGDFADGAGATAGTSNGAYELAAWSPGSLLELERNADYWNDDATSIDTVYYHVLVQDMTQLNRYRAGELHITDNVPPERFQQVREELGDQLRVAPYLGTYYYGYNLTRPPFEDNKALRQALSLAIDRDVLVTRITGRGSDPRTAGCHRERTTMTRPNSVSRN